MSKALRVGLTSSSQPQGRTPQERRNSALLPVIETGVPGLQSGPIPGLGEALVAVRVSDLGSRLWWSKGTSSPGFQWLAQHLVCLRGKKLWLLMETAWLPGSAVPPPARSPDWSRRRISEERLLLLSLSEPQFPPLWLWCLVCWALSIQAAAAGGPEFGLCRVGAGCSLFAMTYLLKEDSPASRRQTADGSKNPRSACQEENRLGFSFFFKVYLGSLVQALGFGPLRAVQPPATPLLRLSPGLERAAEEPGQPSPGPGAGEEEA